MLEKSDLSRLASVTYPVVCFSSIFQMLAKFAEDDRLEQMNAQRRRMRQLEHKRAVEKLIEERKAMLQRDKVVALTLAKILVSRVKPPKIIYSVLPHTQITRTQSNLQLCTRRPNHRIFAKMYGKALQYLVFGCILSCCSNFF